MGSSDPDTPSGFHPPANYLQTPRVGTIGDSIPRLRHSSQTSLQITVPPVLRPSFTMTPVFTVTQVLHPHRGHWSTPFGRGIRWARTRTASARLLPRLSPW